MAAGLWPWKKQGRDGGEAFDSKRFGYHTLILRGVRFSQDSFFSSQRAGGLCRDFNNNLSERESRNAASRDLKAAFCSMPWKRMLGAQESNKGVSKGKLCENQTVDSVPWSIITWMRLRTISRAGSRTDSSHLETSDASKPYTGGTLGPGPNDDKEKLWEVSLQDPIYSAPRTPKSSRGTYRVKEINILTVPFNLTRNMTQTATHNPRKTQKADWSAASKSSCIIQSLRCRIFQISQENNIE